MSARQHTHAHVKLPWEYRRTSSCSVAIHHPIHPNYWDS